MNVRFLVSVIRLYRNIKTKFLHNSARKNFMLNACYCLDKSIPLREMNQKFFFDVEKDWFWRHVLRLCFLLLQSLQGTCNITRCCWSSWTTNRWRTWLLLQVWKGTQFEFAWPRYWASLSSLCKCVPTFSFQFNQRLKEHVFDCSWYRTNPKEHQKMRLPFDGIVQGFLFFPLKNNKPNEGTTWKTNHLHGFAWSSGKLEYDNLFDVFHETNTRNSEVFVKGLEKCKLVLRLFGQNVETWRTSVVQKFKISSLLRKERMFRGSILVILFVTNQEFTAPKRWQPCMEEGICSI